MLQLPKPLEQQVWQDIETIEGKADMKYLRLMTLVQLMKTESWKYKGIAVPDHLYASTKNCRAHAENIHSKY
jgi:hypothetical protein